MTDRQRPPLPEDLGTADVGFVAASGGYVAVCLIALAVTGALALEGSAATVVGVVSSAATVGVVAGAILAGTVSGLPERLGRRRRTTAPLFVVPAGFAIATVAVLVTPLSLATAAGTGLGALVTAGAAFGLASMARERYARAMTTGEPHLTIQWFDPRYPRALFGVGLTCLVVGASTAILSLTVSASGHSLEWLSGRFSYWTVFIGLMFVLIGTSYRQQFDGTIWPAWLRTLRPEQVGKKIGGSKFILAHTSDPSMVPKLALYDAGLLADGPMGTVFVPWSSVTGVELTDETLIIDRRRWRPIRCSRSVLDDSETVLEELERYWKAD